MLLIGLVGVIRESRAVRFLATSAVAISLVGGFFTWIFVNAFRLDFLCKVWGMKIISLANYARYKRLRSWVHISFKNTATILSLR